MTDRDALRDALDRIDDLPRMQDDDGGEWVRWSDVRSVVTMAGLAALAGSGPDAGLREALGALRVYRYVLPSDDETTPTRRHQPFDMVRRDEMLAAVASQPRASVPGPGESAGFDRLVDNLRAEFDQGHFIPWDEVISVILAATPTASPTEDDHAG